MARRATELNEDAKFRLHGINNLERVFRERSPGSACLVPAAPG